LYFIWGWSIWHKQNRFMLNILIKPTLTEMWKVPHLPGMWVISFIFNFYFSLLCTDCSLIMFLVSLVQSMQQFTVLSLSLFVSSRKCLLSLPFYQHLTPPILFNSFGLQVSVFFIWIGTRFEFQQIYMIIIIMTYFVRICPLHVLFQHAYVLFDPGSHLLALFLVCTKRPVLRWEVWLSNWQRF